MYHGYSVSHEKFVWAARLEPGVLSAFSKIWSPDSNLLVSFDGINMTLPRPLSSSTSPRPPPPPTRWPHQDQNSLIRGFQCAQGIINLIDNGPRDGGLVVMRGSHLLNDAFFATHGGAGRKKAAWGAAVPDDWFGFDEGELGWFEGRGCEVVKVCAGAGDLIVWDSRTVHWNVLPEVSLSLTFDFSRLIWEEGRVPYCALRICIYTYICVCVYACVCILQGGWDMS